MSVYLETGQLYKANGKLYLIGTRVPAIPNLWCLKIYPESGRIARELDCLYYRQDNHFKKSRRKIKFNEKKHKELLIRLFSVGSWGKLPDETPGRVKMLLAA